MNMLQANFNFENPCDSKNQIDVSESPQGYYPVLKNELKTDDNICNHCDWRRDCSATICSCMSYRRKDKQAVFFKKLES